MDGFIYKILCKLRNSSETGGERIDNKMPLFRVMQKQQIGRYKFAIPYVQSKEVLDVASGEGLGVSILGKHARSVLGVDYSHKVVKTNKKNYASKNVSFQYGDASKLTLTKKFDIITSFETIEHLDDGLNFLIKTKKLLRPKGKLILSTPNQEFKDLLFNGKHLCPFHKREYYLTDLIKLIRKAGFRKIKVYYYHFCNRKTPYLSLLWYFIQYGFKIVPQSKRKDKIPINFVLVAQ